MAMPILPSVERVNAGIVQILSFRKTGSRALAILYDRDAGITFLGFLFYRADALERIGHCFALRHGALGFSDVVELLETAKAASVVRA